MSRIESPICSKKGKSKTLIILPSHTHTHSSSLPPFSTSCCLCPLFHSAASEPSRLAQLFLLNATFFFSCSTPSTFTLALTSHPFSLSLIRKFRTLQFFFTGTSLATILEIPDTTDFLKTLIHLLQEYDTFGAAEARSKSVRPSSSTSPSLRSSFCCHLYDLGLLSLTKKRIIVYCVFGIDLFQGQENDGGRDDHRRTGRILLSRSPAYRTSSSLFHPFFLTPPSYSLLSQSLSIPH